MIKKLLLFFCLTLFINAAYSQLFYKNEYKTIDGIEIKYKLVHSKLFDKESPVELRIKLKNTNDFDASINLELEYSTGFTKKYGSGEFNICIPKKTSKQGKVHGLAFELKTNDKEIFSSDDAEWEFIKFETIEIEKCSKNN